MTRMAQPIEGGVHARHELSAHNASVRLRLLVLLDAADRSGIAPLTAPHVHAIVYLSNALAPVWDVEPLTPELLKLYGSPYDAEIQTQLDRLVGSGLVTTKDLAYYQDEGGSWRVAASFSIDHDRAGPVLDELAYLPDELLAAEVIREVCLALAALPPELLDRALLLDAAYSDTRSSPYSLIHLRDERGSNLSSDVAESFRRIAPRGTYLSPAEQANLYVRHLARMVANG